MILDKKKYKCVVLTKTPKVELPPKPFICTVSITINNYLLRIPFSGNSKILVDWGDGNEESFSGNITNPGHTYVSSGNYIISVSGTVEKMNSNNVFNSWCSNLISIDQWGELGLINMDRACSDCINLVSIATPLGNPNITSAYYMFTNCTSLTSIPPGLFDNNKAVTSFQSTFYNCYVLTTIPAGLFDNNREVTNFSSTFFVCNSLTAIPAGLFKNNLLASQFQETFFNCSSLTSIPPGLFDNNREVTTFSKTFHGCGKLTGSIPPGLFDNNKAVTTFQNTFRDCTSLSSIPPGLFDNNTAVTSFNATFYRCTSLTGYTPVDSHGELWDRVGVTGTNCFSYCFKLTNYSSIPATWK